MKTWSFPWKNLWNNPWKIICSREKFQQNPTREKLNPRREKKNISFNPWKTRSLWKNRENTGTKIYSAPSQFFHQGQERGFKLSPVLISNWLVRFGEKIWPVKKYHTRENQRFLTREKISNPWKFPNFFPWKINFNPWKNLKKYPWKLWTTREILRKSTREFFFLPVKKTWKRAKRRFHGFFWFSRGKKKHWMAERCL